MELVLTRHFDNDRYRHLDTYVELGGYEALRKAFAMPKERIVEEVRKANLRGRGGAGFPAGVKWGFLPKDLSRPRVLVINADEGEPGTFKDRLIMSRGPHLLIEGIVITCFALSAHSAYIYIRGEFVREARILQEVVDEAYAKGYLGKDILGSGFDLEVTVHRGAGAYICGEETSLINSLEGKRGWPRVKPPFPATIGAFGLPTIVNNVETIADVPWIVTHGGEKFASLGVEKDGGTRLIGVSGPVVRPGVYELPVGTSLRAILYEHAGGLLDGKELKAVIPGGSSTPVLRADEIDVPFSIDAMAKIGTMAGSGGVIVIPEGTCMVRALSVLMNFYAHESCGQCTPCREGTGWLAKVVRRIENGEGQEGDVELILDLCDNMMGRTICPLADAAVMPAESFIWKFREEFDRHIREQKCPYGNRFEVPCRS
ncbi:MAG: NADH oxidoreductase (quinone) subunit F [Deltaproteobacteria bacterium GWC2_65_14]|nr:MAG: NADH oxidoreductase (quinone) subunit F [Deltaproteobacteria bacterium GWC2_65_14]